MGTNILIKLTKKEIAECLQSLNDTYKWPNPEAKESLQGLAWLNPTAVKALLDADFPTKIKTKIKKQTEDQGFEYPQRAKKGEVATYNVGSRYGGVITETRRNGLEVVFKTVERKALHKGPAEDQKWKHDISKFDYRPEVIFTWRCNGIYHVKGTEICQGSYLKLGVLDSYHDYGR